MPTTQYAAVATRSYNDGHYIPNPNYPSMNVNFDAWASDTGLGQGSYNGTYNTGSEEYDAVYGPYYGAMHFGSGSGRPTALSGKIIDAVRLRLTRYSDSPGSSSGVTTTVYETNLTSVPGSGAHSPDGQVIGSGTTSPAMTKGQTVWVTLPIAMAQAAIAGKCLALYTGSGRLSRHYGIEGTADQDPVIEITYHDPIPAPTTSTIVAPGTIKTDSKTFDWSDATDANGIFTPAQLMYEMQHSSNGGSSWGATFTTAAGVSQQAVNLRSYLGLGTGQYYYSINNKIRVRTKTPSYNGTVYYSAWTVLDAPFTIDFRVPPSAPGAPSLSKSAPYEGEAITITLARPASYNALDAAGAANQLTYHAKLATGLELATGAAAVSATSKALSYTVGDLTVGVSDLAASIVGYCVDTPGQTGPSSGGTAITIKRFRVPKITITKPAARTESTAAVYFTISDTGYGGTQGNAQISKVQYQIRNITTNGAWSAWADATLGTWTGLENSFGLTGLDDNTRYGIRVRTINVSPDGTSLSAKTSDVYESMVLEYTPASHIWGNAAATGNEAKAGLSAQALVVGANFGQPVNKGSAYIEKDLTIGPTGVTTFSPTSRLPAGAGFHFTDANGNLFVLRTTGAAGGASDLAILENNSASTPYISFNPTNHNVTIDNTSTGGKWNKGHFQMGPFHFWVDASNRLRMKNGAPTSDTDGTIVGTQA